MSKKIKKNKIKQDKITEIFGGGEGKWAERVELRRCHCINLRESEPQNYVDEKHSK